MLTVLAAATFPVAPAAGSVDRFEADAVEAEALEAFRGIMTLWREEVYFELYDAGTEASKARISQEEFAQRMVKSDWLPEGELNPKFVSADFRFRTMVYVSARLHFRNKFDPDRQYDKQGRMLLLKEDGAWRVDLIQLIRSPFA